MDAARITKALERALREGVQQFEPDPSVPDYLRTSFQTEVWANNFVRVNESTEKTVVEVLEDEASLRMFRDGGVIMTKQGNGLSIELEDVARWLLAQTLLHGSDAAAKRLEEFVGGQHRGMLDVLAITGVAVKREVRLVQGVTLVPFEEVPPWHMTETLGSVTRSLVPFTISKALRPSPTAALIGKIDDSIELLERFPDPGEEPASDSVQPLLGRVCQCLTLVGPSCPTPIAQWSQPVSPMMVPLLPTGHGWGHSVEEAYPQESTPFSDDEDLPWLVEKYLDLSEDLRSRLDVPLRRLNLALRRQNVVDRAIELGVALEALLVADKESGATISYLLRVRGAWLGGGSMAQRRHNKALLREAYDLRSKAVHTGRLNDSAAETLRECSELCAKLIRGVIERGAMPDWETLILTPDIG